jgi:hypothetical protein
MTNTSSSISLHKETEATRALLKFCIDHNRAEGDDIESIRACLAALEEGKIKEALSHYQRVPLGGMMCFNDWWPRCVIESETPEYVATVFVALTNSVYPPTRARWKGARSHIGE